MRRFHHIQTISSPRFRALGALLVLAPLALALKYYPGPGRWWLNNWGASFGYEIFFMLLAFVFFPRKSAVTKIALLVCVVTCALEFAQLWKPPFLEAIRSTFLGRSLVGNQFSWLDFPAYPAGCFLGWILLRRLNRPKS